MIENLKETKVQYIEQAWPEGTNDVSGRSLPFDEVTPDEVFPPFTLMKLEEELLTFERAGK